MRNVTSPWKVKLPSHMNGVSHNSYESGTMAFGNLTSIFFFVDIPEKLLPVLRSELFRKSSHCLACLASRHGAKWYTSKPVATRQIRKNAPSRKAPHREIVHPLLRPNVVVWASITARTSRDWVISRVSLDKKFTVIWFSRCPRCVLIIAGFYRDLNAS